MYSTTPKGEDLINRMKHIEELFYVGDVSALGIREGQDISNYERVSI